jgi:hypothetical protein
VVELVRGVGIWALRGIVGLELGTVTRAPSPAVGGEVDEDPARVGDRVFHPADLRPTPRDLQQGLLHEILGVGQIARNQVRRPQQPIRGLRNEPVELGAVLGGGLAVHY